MAATENIKKKIRELYPAWKEEAIVLLNVNASDMLPQRRWPQQNFAEVAGQLLNTFSNIVIIATGSPAEREYVEEVVKMTGHQKFINSAGFRDISKI